MTLMKPCPHCGEHIEFYRNPVPTVDILIFDPAHGVVLVERKNPPFGWALPGGFVDYGESCETAAVREAKEETGLDVVLERILGVYSDPDRDPRQHTMSVAYVARAADISQLKAGDDAKSCSFYRPGELPELAFDHARILDDYLKGVKRLNPNLCP